jgi:hypothetical protein
LPKNLRRGEELKLDFSGQRELVTCSILVDLLLNRPKSFSKNEPAGTALNQEGAEK